MSFLLFTENIIAKALSIYRESRHYITNQRMHFVYIKHKGYSVEMIADILMVSRKTI